MANEQDNARSAFTWNGGGWFGSQLGCTLWLLILGIVLSWRDVVAASVCASSFVILNAWGLYLWHRREQLSAYAGLQRFLLATSVVIAAVVAVVNLRGVSEPPTPGAMVSTYLPYGVIVVAPALMLFFFLQERSARRARG
jgi:hypothetical protein